MTAQAPPDPIDAPASSRKKSRIGLVALLVLILVGAGAFVWRLKFDTYHLATVQPGKLYRAGNQDLRRFGNAIEKVKPKTVVCVVDEEEVASPEKKQFAREFDFLKQQQIQVERIPVLLGGYPTTDDVRRFLSIAEANEKGPVLVHCAQGIRRTGMFVAAYQMSVLGYDKERAKSQILAFGHSDRTINDIKKFIDLYDPKQRTIPPIERSKGSE
jgi:protein tyrosine phosphatase (PTP) superfamily phosphohydrolase (DUF442 family)